MVKNCQILHLKMMIRDIIQPLIPAPEIDSGQKSEGVHCRV